MLDNTLLQKTAHLVSRFEEVGTLITDPLVIADMDRYVKLNKEYSELERIISVRNEYLSALNSIEEAKAILDSENDPELRSLANEELSENTEIIPDLEEQIKLLISVLQPLLSQYF